MENQEIRTIVLHLNDEEVKQKTENLKTRLREASRTSERSSRENGHRQKPHEVESLNESFKKMETRTPREQLNALAADAGRLGIQSKKDVLDFVAAADQLNVALGEDLSADGVKNIGKLAQLFGDDKKMGLKTRRTQE